MTKQEERQILDTARANGFLLLNIHPGRKGTEHDRLTALWSKHCMDAQIPDVRMLLSKTGAVISYKMYTAPFQMSEDGVRELRNAVMGLDRLMGKKSWDQITPHRGCIERVPCDKASLVLAEVVRCLGEFRR